MLYRFITLWFTAYLLYGVYNCHEDQGKLHYIYSQRNPALDLRTQFIIRKTKVQGNKLTVFCWWKNVILKYSAYNCTLSPID